MTQEEAQAKAAEFEQKLKDVQSAQEKAATKEEVEANQKALEKLQEDFKSVATKEQIEDMKQTQKEQGEFLEKMKTKGGMNMETIQSKVSKFIDENFDEIKSIKSKGAGLLEFTIKEPALMTTGAANNPDGIPEMVGVQQAPPTNVNLRTDSVWNLTNNVPTNSASFPYTETVPKDGDYSFVGEGEVKPQIDFRIQTRYAEPKKLAAWIKLTDEAVQDIPQLQSIATDYLRKKHDRKRAKAILTGDGTGENPTGATSYGRAFTAGAMATAVENPNFMDVINAAITDIYTTHNYDDELNYSANIVLVNPVDFFLQIVSAKDGNRNPLYPSASLYNQVVIGGVTIMPDEDIPTGKIFVADMSKYNTTNYVGYTVKIGWVNDDFIRNQFVILGESRFHAFVKELDKQAFIYDDIATIKTAIDSSNAA